MKEWAPLEVEYYKRAYAAAGKGNYDIYVVFVERALRLLNPRGRLGFILPHKFFNAQYGEPLRGLLAGGRHLAEIVHFGDQQVFHAATTYTCLLFLDRAGRDAFRFERVADLAAWREAREVDPKGLADLSGLAAPPISADRATAAEWNFTVGAGAGLFEKLRAMPVKLGDVADKIFQGLVTSADAVYLLEPTGTQEGECVTVKSNATGKEYVLETGVTWPLCKGSRDVRRYAAVPSKYVLFPYDAEASARTGKTI